MQNTSADPLLADTTDRCQTTFRLERLRAISGGILETANSTFLLLIAVRVFHANATSKAWIASGVSLGMLLTPLTVWIVHRLQWRISYTAGRMVELAAFFYVLAMMVHTTAIFVACSVIATAVVASIVPLLTQMFQENYPEKIRGKLFSKAVMIRVGTAVLFAQIAGLWLDGHLERHVWLLLIFAISAFFAGNCLRRCPTGTLQGSANPHPFQAMVHIKHDRLFRWTLISWMFMGFGNLMMLPLRVEYLANERYGLALSPTMIALLTGVVPNLARMLVTPIWGRLFDRMNFFVLRVTLNIGFIIGILAFFTGDTLMGMILGATVFGISNAGGDVAWGLWVTKLAPPDRVADYMSVHTFLTGIRGVIAPMVAFQLASHYSMTALGIFSVLLILIASAMLVPEMKGRGLTRSEMLVDDL